MIPMCKCIGTFHLPPEPKLSETFRAFWLLEKQQYHHIAPSFYILHLGGVQSRQAAAQRRRSGESLRSARRRQEWDFDAGRSNQELHGLKWHVEPFPKEVISTK